MLNCAELRSEVTKALLAWQNEEKAPRHPKRRTVVLFPAIFPLRAPLCTKLVVLGTWTWRLASQQREARRMQSIAWPAESLLISGAPAAAPWGSRKRAGRSRQGCLSGEVGILRSLRS